MDDGTRPCGAVARHEALGSRAYRTELPREAEAEDPSTPDVPAVVYYCPACAERGFGSA